MKKTTLVISLLVIVLIALAPLIGNSFMQKLINENIKNLASNGIVLSSEKEESNYLNTKKHFEFILKNSDAFVNYLRAYTKTRIPVSMNALLQGAIIGVDVEYSNIPFSKAITLEIYPRTFSKKLMQQMQIKSPDVYKHIKTFLDSKGILYHIEYNLLSEDFSGFIKNIDDAYTLQKNKKISMKLLGAHFQGKGNIAAPKSLNISINTVKFHVQDAVNNFTFNIDSFESSSTFISYTNYSAKSKIHHIDLSLQSPKEDVKIGINNLHVNSFSKKKNEKVTLGSKTSIENFGFHSQKVDFDIENFNTNVSMKGLEAKSFESFIKLLARSANVNKALLQVQVQSSLTHLLSRGFKIEIPDISFSKFTLNKVRDLGSAKINAQMQVKADKDVIKKLKISPMLLLSNLWVKVNISLANAMYLKIIENSPMASTIASYAKKDGDNVYFHILFDDSTLMVNDKVIK
jgi:hypothetical protein